MRSSDAWRLAIVASHPIQYFAPLYRRLARTPDIDLNVYFCSRAGLDVYEDEGFGGEAFAWDIPLLEGYNHTFVPNLHRERAPGGFLSLVNPGIVKALRRRKYDAVWLHGHAYASFLLAAAGAKLAGRALFMRFDTHLGLYRPPLRRALRAPVMTAFYRLFDACLAIGTRNAAFYRRHRVPENRIIPVPYVVDNAFFRQGALAARKRLAESRRSFGLPPPKVPIILYVAKLVRQKRPMDLLRAYQRCLRWARGEAGLAFVGSGPERKALEEYVTTHEVPGVHFLGFRNQSELPSIYGSCDVFVRPSENESGGWW